MCLLKHVWRIFYNVSYFEKGGGGSPQDQFVFVFKVLSAFHIRLHVLEAGPYKVMMSEDVVRETKLTNSFS